MTANKNKHRVESNATAQARIAQAQTLKAQAAENGLLSEAHWYQGHEPT